MVTSVDLVPAVENEGDGQPNMVHRIEAMPPPSDEQLEQLSAKLGLGQLDVDLSGRTPISH